MNLDWKRAGQASIAAIGETHTAIVTYRMDDPEDNVPWAAEILEREEGKQVAYLYNASQAGAEAWAEKKAEEFDKPVWREDREGWLWSTVWRGVQVLVRSYQDHGNLVWIWSGDPEQAYDGCLPSAQAAKAAAENWVRQRITPA